MDHNIPFMFSEIIMNNIKKDELSKSNKTLIPYGNRAFSQYDEDGIILEIFKRIGTKSKVFVEFGICGGLYDNTLLLLHQGWKGLWIDSEEQNIISVYNKFIKNGSLNMVKSFITAENINNLICSGFSSMGVLGNDIDFISVDIDCNDIYVMDAITCVSPRVICIEYNATFPPPVRYCRKYEPDYKWNGDNNFGASLSHMQDVLGRKGYSVVGCNISGVNAFFVRNDCLGDNFYKPGDPESHYMPLRYYLSLYPGHPVRYTTLTDAIIFE